MVDSVGWPWAFYLNLPLGALSPWCGAPRLTEAKRPESRRRVDVVGMLLLMVGVGAVALSIVQSESPHWNRPELPMAAATGLTTLIGFVAWARVTPGPLLVVPFAVLTGRLAACFGHRPLLVGGSLIYASSGVWLMLVPGAQADCLRQWLPGLMMSDIAVGMVLPSLSAAAVDRLPADQYAVGSGVNQATRQIGSVLGVAITALLLGHAGLHRSDFTRPYTVHVVLALLTAALCLPVGTRPHAAKA